MVRFLFDFAGERGTLPNREGRTPARAGAGRGWVKLGGAVLQHGHDHVAGFAFADFTNNDKANEFLRPY